jgi:peptidoglycan lytic transglycosylase
MIFSIVFVLLFSGHPTTETGIASYYGKKGGQTASGERVDPNALTAAHKKLPFNSLVKVTNLKNKKSVIVRITDRGPYIKGRIIDLTRGAFLKISSLNAGICKVKIKVIKIGDNKRKFKKRRKKRKKRKKYKKKRKKRKKYRKYKKKRRKLKKKKRKKEKKKRGKRIYYPVLGPFGIKGPSWGGMFK